VLGLSAQVLVGVGLVAVLLAVTVLGVGIIKASIRLHQRTRGAGRCNGPDDDAWRGSRRWWGGYRPSCSRALTMGAREALIMPSRGRLSSRMRKSDAEAESAQTRRTTTTVALRGAKRPKVP